MGGAANMLEQPRLGPVGESDRIRALDVTRGFALVGILLVNIGTFGEAFGYFMMQAPRGDRGPYEWWCWVIGKAFWESRFYPLFSMLFGMGLVIQFNRAKASGRRFGPPAVRRMLVLAFIGALHATLLWYGDILFLYGIVGLLMIVLVRLSAKVLAIIAISILAFAAVSAIGFGLLTMAMVQEGAERRVAITEPAAQSAESPSEATGEASPSSIDERARAVIADTVPDAADDRSVESKEGAADPESFTVPGAERSGAPFMSFIDALRNGGMQGPDDPRWIEFETRAYRDGPWMDAFLFRVMTWVMFLLISLLFFAWNVLAMFCLGAAIMKWGIFDPSRRPWHRRFVAVAVFVAAPISLATAIALPGAGYMFTATSSAIQLIVGPLLSLGYLSAIIWIVQSGVLTRVTSVLAAAGRMAFTNYLMQTMIATAIFYHWGLGLFDSTTRLERVGMVLAIYAFQLAFSVMWLKVFAMGPLEWFWRAATYLRFTPLRRARA